MRDFYAALTMLRRRSFGDTRPLSKMARLKVKEQEKKVEELDRAIAPSKAVLSCTQIALELRQAYPLIFRFFSLLHQYHLKVPIQPNYPNLFSLLFFFQAHSYHFL